MASVGNRQLGVRARRSCSPNPLRRVSHLSPDPAVSSPPHAAMPRKYTYTVRSVPFHVMRKQAIIGLSIGLAALATACGDAEDPTGGDELYEVKTCTELQDVATEELLAMFDRNSSEEAIDDFRDQVNRRAIELRDEAIEAGLDQQILVCENLNLPVSETFTEITGGLEP